MLNALEAFENLICYHYERSCFVSERTGAAFSQRRIINNTKAKPLYIACPVLPGGKVFPDCLVCLIASPGCTRVFGFIFWGAFLLPHEVY